MKFLIDAQLPPSLKEVFTETVMIAFIHSTSNWAMTRPIYSSTNYPFQNNESLL